MWLRLICNSFVVAFIAAAAQIAVAQATGIIAWGDVGTTQQWHALLTWVAFIYLVAVLVGASLGRRVVRRPTRPDNAPARIVAALTAAVGASAAVSVAWLPARGAHPPVSVHPEPVV